MRSSSIHEIKQELVNFKTAELTSLCLRLVRFKKENKELLTYLLFEAQDEQVYHVPNVLKTYAWMCDCLRPPDGSVAMTPAYPLQSG